MTTLLRHGEGRLTAQNLLYAIQRKMKKISGDPILLLVGMVTNMMLIMVMISKLWRFIDTTLPCPFIALDNCRANYHHINFLLLIPKTFFVHHNYELVIESLVLMVLQNTSFSPISSLSWLLLRSNLFC